MKFDIKQARVSESVKVKINDAIERERIDELPAGSLAEGVADAVIILYREKIEAGLRRAGIDVQPGQALNIDTLRVLLSKRAGLDIRSWAGDDVVQAVSVAVSGALSEALGVQISLDGDIRSQVVLAAIEAVKNNKPGKLVTQATINRLRDLAALGQLGLGPQDARRLKNRAYQKKYSLSHKQAWV